MTIGFEGKSGEITVDSLIMVLQVLLLVPQTLLRLIILSLKTGSNLETGQRDHAFIGVAGLSLLIHSWLLSFMYTKQSSCWLPIYLVPFALSKEPCSSASSCLLFQPCCLIGQVWALCIWQLSAILVTSTLLPLGSLVLSQHLLTTASADVHFYPLAKKKCPPGLPPKEHGQPLDFSVLYNSSIIASPLLWALWSLPSESSKGIFSISM